MESLFAFIEDLYFEKYATPLHISKSATLGGGCINNSLKIFTARGTLFLKYNKARLYPAMFEKEALGLKLLERNEGLEVPSVMLLGENENYTFILMEFFESVGSTASHFLNFGKNLALMHKKQALTFGLDHDNYIGSLIQYNEPREDWIDFFVDQRLERQLRRARDGGRVSNYVVEAFHNLFPKLKNILPIEPPSLLHGDLWSGNFLSLSENRTALIDPAVYYGNREAEIAFTKLFGGFDAEFYTAYDENYPLISGFSDRIDIYNLYPLLVHVNLFGGGYVRQVENVMRRFKDGKI